MSTLKPLLVALGAATALSLVPMTFGAAAPVGIAQAQAATASVKIDIFFKPLAAHGVWVKHPKYRYVFCPKVDAGWRPYTHGHWIYLDRYGWYFASDEPFAWAVYHYGRWFHEARLGWCWVPGNAWAGAWVAWRRSNDYVGWAALPPSNDGFAVNVDISRQEPPKDDWIFVPPKRFLEPRLSVAIVLGDQHPDVFEKTKYVGPVVVQNNIVVNNVIDVNFIQQVTNTQVTVVKPQIVDDPAKSAADASNGQVDLFAPQIEPPTQKEAPEQAVDEDQAAQQLGNPSQPSSEASSASSEQPSSAEASASSAPASETSSSSAPASSTSSSAASSSAEASSSAAPSSEASSSLTPSSEASSAAPVQASSSAEPSSASTPASSSEPASSSASKASSSAPPPSSSEAASSSSAEKAAPSAAPASSSEEQAAPSSKEKGASSLECPKGYVIVDGKCVPDESSAAGDNGAAAQ